MAENNLTVIELTEENIESMIYEIRGQRVILDFDLASIYGYETRYFNRQVKNNIDKFPEDFMFQLTNAELEDILRRKKCITKKSSTESEESSWCKNFTLNKSGESSWSQKLTLNKSGNLRGYNIKYLPYAFTEQGIYMLMTVLRGELAVKQSKALIRLFKKMKDYIVGTKGIIDYRGIIELTNKVNKHESDIENINNKLSIVMDNFINPDTYKHFLILEGEKLEADIAFQSIYALANHSIYIIDNYVNIKTLQLLSSSKDNVQIVLFTDNLAKNKLTQSVVEDFLLETKKELLIKECGGIVHDRYIVIDYKDTNEKIYLCGTSSKDAGNKVTTIIEIKQKDLYHPFIDALLNNQIKEL